MDAIDNKILSGLIGNSRIPITRLAKRVGASREVVTYRMNRLKKEGVIHDFVAEINIQKLGYIGAAVFINIKATRQKSFKEFLENCNFVSWVAELSGLWNFGLSIYAKTNEELDKKFLVLYNNFKNDIIDHRFTLHRKNSFFYEKYFGTLSSKRKQKSKYNPVIDNIDKIDKLILKELAKNSRIDCITLSKKVSLTSPAVIKRIKQMEAAGIIEKYSLFLDISKLGLFQYSIFITNKDINEKKKLLFYLQQHKYVPFVAEYVGDEFLEFGLFVNDPYELRRALQEIEEKFPNNRTIEISLFQKEAVSIGPPECIFE